MRAWLNHIHRSSYCYLNYPGLHTADMKRDACPCGWIGPVEQPWHEGLPLGKTLGALIAERGESVEEETLLDPSDIPADYPVQPLPLGSDTSKSAICGTCGLAWDDTKSTSMTPTPAGRCPFEYFHKAEK